MSTDKKNINNCYDVIIVGGGASGMFASIYASKALMQTKTRSRVLILEKNDQLGKKLKITGGGRCNITNSNPDFESFISNYKDSKKFLYTPFSIFNVKDTFNFFENRGLQLITEDHHRAFPITQKAISVFNVLYQDIKDLKIEVLYNKKVESFKTDNNKIISILDSDGLEYKAKSFILSTGGMSHPETGSTGDGFRMLKSIGHNVISADMSLVPLVSRDSFVKTLSGLSFDNIKFKVILDNKVISRKSGKVLFTEFGLSGPAILNISKSVKQNLSSGKIQISFDLMPDITMDRIDNYLLDLIKNNHSKKIKNISLTNIQNSLWIIILAKSNISEDIICSSLTKKQRLVLSNLIKNFTVNICDTLGYEKSIVSSGGVDLESVDFKTMRSKIFDNLYVTGDILNIDRPSGGFSLQLCWTTGAIAGQSSAVNILRT